MIGRRFYGKFRGTVSSNQDDEHRGRITAKVPDVFGDDDSDWALPALPFAGPKVGLFLVPPAGAHVWIEFEHGDPRCPIWSGCFWPTKDDCPAQDGSPEIKVLQTPAGRIAIDDRNGKESITIQTAGDKPMKVFLDKQKMEISNVGASPNRGTITIQGDSVAINSNGLKVD